MADDVRIAEGDAVAPLAAAVLATIPLAQLPAGRYKVTVKSMVSNAAAADIGNTKLATTGGTVADIANPLPTGVSGAWQTFIADQVLLDGASNLVVSVIANATSAIEYGCDLQAQRIG